MARKPRVSVLATAPRRVVAVALAAALLWWAFISIHQPLTIRFDARSAEMAMAEAFVAEQPGQYVAERSRQARLDASRTVGVSLDFNVFYSWRELRLDPAKRAIDVIIGRVELESRWNTQSLEPARLLESMSGRHDIGPPRLVGEGLLLPGTGRDPQFRIAIEPALFKPAPLQKALAVLPALLLGGLLWGLFELAARWAGRQRVIAVGQRLGGLLAAIGTLIENRPQQVVGILGLVALPLLLAFQLELARMVPFYQGPDEEAQIPVAFAGFHQMAFDGEGRCAHIWEDLVVARDDYMPLARRHRLPVTQAHVDVLERLRENAPPTAETPLQRVSRQTCGDKYALTYLYNPLPALWFRANPDTPAVDYLTLVRHGQTLLTYFLYGVLFWVLARGQSLLRPWLSEAGDGRLRLGLGVSLVVYAAMPQMLFMTSVVNDSGYAVPIGMFLLVSFFYWHRLVTPVLLALALFLFANDLVAYLAVAGVLLLWLTGRGLYQWRPHPLWLWLPVVITLGGIAAGPVLLQLMDAYRHVIPFRLPGTLAGAEYPGLYYMHLLEMLHLNVSFGLLDYNSFFGVLGQLDTVMPERAVIAYKSWVFGGLLVAGVAMAVRLWRRLWSARTPTVAETSAPVGRLAVLAMVAVCVPLAVALAAYGIYNAHGSGPNDWGPGVQGRYFLPIFLFPFSFLAIATLLAARGVRMVGLIAVVFITVSAGVILYTAGLVHETLMLRYYASNEIFEAYRALLPGG
ncbi:hypothetical protein [Spiribacter pallidus]|uniref:Uncharacterized protein n=1 Tax=Spiribacter pallidus TaxID=1987936 RepID=A0ABV3TCS9_9GAMM